MRSSLLNFLLISLFCLSFAAFSSKTKAQTPPLRVAVAANFYPVLEKLLPEFKSFANLPNQPDIQLISAASGTLYQQIIHGAPFDIFLSADAIRPQQLVNQQLASAESLTTYAIGQLSLWSANQNISSLNVLNNLNGKLAIANPNIAPYGIAAKQVLENLNLWQNYKNKLVTGMNINQTFQQVHSGAVNLGIVAKSQLLLNNLKGFDIPAHLYNPISQQLVIINRTKQPLLAEQFSDFLLSEHIQNKFTAYGYLSATAKINQTTQLAEAVQ